ncbi:aspartate 1-decarboxylase autocleavage activator PanM [Providencia sp. PROV188]|uniref:aspartate 1-decarboxylase autocleavage activator PanM n=1 Tax=Providencia TaxID=586 RepID=UPI000D36042A|nr:MULTISPECIES: aspartate 1-decarboxylase autocleavage activator PanM [Providencia]MBG5883194.1 aspartate 1-decarboxylase autocleavage activator PanM [Providencia alcalifaciens]MBS0924058.1 aspartate 1-decarboxylase autocleavage activator PanM [Providencia sp. JGM181]MBS0934302.1 aspartate 1-decarboxylase autocleavage activator PanM [Providencia sp. JGM172]MBS0998015.1 aspartate 1-decarboxylase autocleavage activator PanM [Providencia sp. JGM178]MDR2243491.1 aspartate 1-decarboxylase autoclea
MRLTIIPLVNPTEQQYIDLSKIWLDQSRTQLEQNLESGVRFYGARFNERLLAAAKVVIYQQQGTICDFNVREITRRRGVGLYLLQEIFRQQPEIRHWIFDLQGVEPQNKIALEKFLVACGFQPAEETHHWQLNIEPLV